MTRTKSAEELINSFGTGDTNQYKIVKLLENIATTLAAQYDADNPDGETGTT